MIDVKLGRELEAKATEGPWEVKPHGRLGWVLVLGATYIDLSVMTLKET